MRILFVFTGFAATSGARMTAEDLPLFEDLLLLPTSHASEINFLLLCYWLRELGHEVCMLSRREAAIGQRHHFPLMPIQQLKSESFDTLLLFKIHGLRTAQELGLFDHQWSQVAAWLDACAPQNIIGENAKRISRFAWGTHEILEWESKNYPGSAHVVCEHATTFSAPPALKDAKPRGLYVGRLPPEYLRQVKLAAESSPVLAHALWIEFIHGQKTLLRPHQRREQELQEARTKLPAQLTLESGINVLARASELSSCAYGICPATIYSPHQQLLSASKFYDYLALGLPVVLADNTPEAKHVVRNPELGELFAQGESGKSISRAVTACLTSSKMAGFDKRRAALQSWVFSGHTYKQRAEILHELLTA